MLSSIPDFWHQMPEASPAAVTVNLTAHNAKYPWGAVGWGYEITRVENHWARGVCKSTAAVRTPWSHPKVSMKGDAFNGLYLVPLYTVHGFHIFSRLSMFSFPLAKLSQLSSPLCFPGTFPQLGSQERARRQCCPDAQPFTRAQAGASSAEERLFPGENEIKSKLIFSLRTAATFLSMLRSPNLDYLGWLKMESYSSLNVVVACVLCPL